MPQPGPSDPHQTREQVGRFCPIQIPDPANINRGIIDDFDEDQIDLHRYSWARDLFDYLTVDAPATDYLPNDWTMIASHTAKPVQNDSNHPRLLSSQRFGLRPASCCRLAGAIRNSSP